MVCQLVRLMCCVACLLVIGVPVPADGHPDDIHWQPGPSLPGIDGHVYALTVYDGRLIAGGHFNVACNTLACNIAAWDGSSWSPLGEGTDDRVCVLAVHDGRLIAGGYFETAGGVPAYHVAAWDGGSWAPLGSGTDSAVEALVSYEGELVVGGRFSNAGGVPAHYIASWDGASWDSLGSGMNNSVNALTVHDNQLIAGGAFSIAGGIPAGYMAAWNGAAWDTLDSGTNGTVYALAVYGGSLIAGGSFSTAGGVSAGYIASWDGDTWAPLGSCVDRKVQALNVGAGVLYAGGNFDYAGGIMTRKVASWDGASWAPLGGGFDSGEVHALACYDGDVIAAGYFDDADGTAATNIAAWDGASWYALGSGWIGGIANFALFQGKLIAAGSFLEIEGVAANRIAAWDGFTWSPLGTGLNDDVAALTVCNYRLFAGGKFTTAGGVPVACVAAWNGLFWEPVGSIDIAGQNGRPVEALGCYFDSPIAASWYHDSYANQNWWFIYRWDGLDWTCIGSGIEPYHSVLGIRAFTVYNYELIAAGSFGSIGGVTAVGLAAWNGSAWSSVGSGGGAMWTFGLGVHAGELYVGGAMGHLRRWDGSTWSSLPGIGDFDCFYAFTSLGDSLVIGGAFPMDGGSLVNNIVVWDGAACEPLGSGLNGAVTALETFGNTVFAAGNFTTAGGKISAYLARWVRNPGVAVLISDFRANPVAGDIELDWSLSADESIEGFRLYRSCDDEPAEHLLNKRLIEPDSRSYVDDTARPGERYFYTLAALTADGREIRSVTIEAEIPPVAMRLFQNTPNPFNPSTSIRFTIPVASRVELRVFDLAGRPVRTLIDEEVPAGSGEAEWDGTNDTGSSAASGVYFYRLRAGKATLSRKMLLLR